MNRNPLCRLVAMVIGLMLVLSLSGRAWSVQERSEPTDEEIIRIVYPDGELTKDVQNRYVIEGGKDAEGDVHGDGTTPKIIKRIDRLRGPLYEKNREDLVVLVDILNRDAADCCKGELVLAVFDLRETKAKPIWIHHLRHMRLVGGDVSLVAANNEGTQQILFKYETWAGLIKEAAILYVPRPNDPKWPGYPLGGRPDPSDQPFVKIWLGHLKWNEGPFLYDYEQSHQSGTDFSRAAYTSKIWFVEHHGPGWKLLIEERTVTMLLGKKLDTPLNIRLTYGFMTNGYYLRWGP